MVCRPIASACIRIRPTEMASFSRASRRPTMVACGFSVPRVAVVEVWRGAVEMLLGGVRAFVQTL